MRTEEQDNRSEQQARTEVIEGVAQSTLLKYASVFYFGE